MAVGTLTIVYYPSCVFTKLMLHNVMTVMIKFYSKCLKEREYLGTRGLHRRTIFKWTLIKYLMANDWIQVAQKTFDNGNKTSVFIQQL
jgi:hypothetical protein